MSNVGVIASSISLGALILFIVAAAAVILGYAAFRQDCCKRMRNCVDNFGEEP